jgi:hypothetical protein
LIVIVFKEMRTALDVFENKRVGEAILPGCVRRFLARHRHRLAVHPPSITQHTAIVNITDIVFEWIGCGNYFELCESGEVNPGGGLKGPHATLHDAV